MNDSRDSATPPPVGSDASPPAAGRVVAATDQAIAEAGRLLAEGGLVAFPTETVYGLGADATNDYAVAAIFAAKDRPRFNPLIVHVPDIDAARRLVRFDDRALVLARRFWPGPLTLVLPRLPESRLSLLVSAGLETVAVRIPAHPVARALLDACAHPVAAPSANRSGEVSPTTAAHVATSLDGRVGMILDGGACPVGVESTVLDLSGAQAVLLRPGGVTLEALEAEIGPVAVMPEAAPAPEGALPSPGMMTSHYAPRLPVRLGVHGPREGAAFLAFGPRQDGTLNLSGSGDLREAAANLFAMLRALDRPEFSAIDVAPIPNEGLGRAINDRLRRAAAPRPTRPPHGPQTS